MSTHFNKKLVNSPLTNSNGCAIVGFANKILVNYIEANKNLVSRGPRDAPPSGETKNHGDPKIAVIGGRGWIRTTEAEGNRFTVCPI